jgi:5-methyltetrahydrofolate--homocysteine methyltransferase
MDLQGGYRAVDWDPFEAADRIVAITRQCVRKWLAGEPLLTEAQVMPQPVVQAVAARRVEEAGPQLSAEQMEAVEQVRERLLSFDGPGLQSAVRAALDAGLSPFAVVTLGMAEGMAEVGRRYEAGEFFLPQLVMAGVTMRQGMNVLEPLLKRAEAGARKGTIVIGTVRGDLHDIGKNIVKTMLEAAGFVVHDIGVDQPVDNFVNVARQTGADIVAMSALLTTTMPYMARVIAALKEAGLADRVRVMVGGAPISREFADRIGAEGYAPDAVKAVREAERLMSLGQAAKTADL